VPPCSRPRLGPLATTNSRLGNCLGRFRQQVGLDRRGHVQVQRDPAFLRALASNPRPPAADIDAFDYKASTFPARSPQNSISAAMARSRHVRRLPRRVTSRRRPKRPAAGWAPAGAAPNGDGDGEPHAPAVRRVQQPTAIGPSVGAWWGRHHQIQAPPRLMSDLRQIGLHGGGTPFFEISCGSR
jgi:hypothetical protein